METSLKRNQEHLKDSQDTEPRLKQIKMDLNEVKKEYFLCFNS